ncbi:uncharacterized protein SCHCODRAFT_02537484 [Schizophyllum commune H4-8]|uniref:uncharacterized protein n=1 Tax=Schizophyllum commune (strain H4-8 / FGSC 9210) TaxID=578458 RepID=UPI00215FE21D|nr:uncharacterized protein SCHCODRAFT_02537484 [Schizophyllum commune H4-8]KAI5892977.1 hypothetical protein SCHCODRAFT_02537484 [Schizophyllum commune H4-8]
MLAATTAAISDFRQALLNGELRLSPAELENARSQAHLLLSALEYAQNMHAPGINQVPPEVLGHVFRLLQPFSGDDFLPSFPDRQIYQWTCVARVCKYWKGIAVNDPSLWSTIELCHDSSPAAVPVLIRRSRNNPLRLYHRSRSLFLKSDKNIGILRDMLATQRSRIEHLHLDLQDARSNYMTIIGDAFAKVVPHLRSVSIDLKDLFSRSPHAFKNVTEQPSVVQLTVTGSALDSLHIFPSLVRLAVSRITDVSQACLFVQCLRQLPRLEELCMFSIRFVTDDYHPPPIVNLPRLQRLYIAEIITHPLGSCLLSSIDVPTSCACLVSPRRTLEILENGVLPGRGAFRPPDAVTTVQIQTVKRGAYIHNGTLVASIHDTLAVLPDLESRDRITKLIIPTFSAPTSGDREWLGFLNRILRSSVQEIVAAENAASGVIATLDMIVSAAPPMARIARPQLKRLRIYAADAYEKERKEGFMVLQSLAIRCTCAGIRLQGISIHYADKMMVQILFDWAGTLVRMEKGRADRWRVEDEEGYIRNVPTIERRKCVWGTQRQESDTVPFRSIGHRV